MANPRLRCPHCQARMTVLDPDRLGRLIHCPRCSRSFAPAEEPEARRPSTPAAEQQPGPGEEVPPGLIPPSPMFWLIGGGGLALVVAVVAGAWLLLGGSDEPVRARKGKQAD